MKYDLNPNGLYFLLFDASPHLIGLLFFTAVSWPKSISYYWLTTIIILGIHHFNICESAACVYVCVSGPYSKQYGSYVTATAALIDSDEMLQNCLLTVYMSR
jgi:hypothetical protein